MKLVKLKIVKLENKKRVALLFSNESNIKSLIRNISGCKWDNIKCYWHIPFYKNYLEFLNNKFKDRINFYEDVNLVPEAFNECLKLRRLSTNTIIAYKSTLNRFLNYCNIKKVKPIPKFIQEYILYLIDDCNISVSYQNQVINSSKIYFEVLHGIEVTGLNKLRARKSKKLPVVFSVQEVQVLINGITNVKHKCMILLIYSAGLRRSELINLKVTDIDSNRNCIMIKDAKGKKDRITLLSPKVLIQLREYYKLYRSKIYFFEGVEGGCYGVTSLRKIFYRALKKSEILKKGSLHTLRHSFATHLLEQGVNLRYIQSLLGHSSSKTTEIYTHITTEGFKNIKSPIENWNPDI